MSRTSPLACKNEPLNRHFLGWILLRSTAVDKRQRLFFLKGDSLRMNAAWGGGGRPNAVSISNSEVISFINNDAILRSDRERGSKKAQIMRSSLKYAP